MIIQLKPLQNSFYTFIMNKLRNLDIIILCEGKMEVEIIKEIIKRFKMEFKDSIGVSDCEGIKLVPMITYAVALLVKLARKLRTMVVIIDAEEMDVKNRVRSLIDSLRARNLKVKPVLRETKQIFKTYVSSNERKLTLFIAINGEFTLPFKKHKIEDHIVKLMLLEGRLSKNDIAMYKDSKQIVHDIEEVVSLLRQAKLEHIRKAFYHICILLKMLGK